MEELAKIPFGVFSGLKKEKISGIFFYYEYGNDFHFWYLYDIKTRNILTSKTDILNYIKCKRDEERVIPSFFEEVYDINRLVMEEIERTYKEIELSNTQDSQLKELNRSNSTKFIKKMIDEIEIQISEYLYEYPNDTSVEHVWENIKSKLLSLPPTKKRLQALRQIWKSYKKGNDWKHMIEELGNFMTEKGIFKKTKIGPFDASRLRLVTMDFIS